LRNLAGQLHDIVAGLFDQISQFSFKTLGGIGAVALVMMVVTMLSRVEESFNMIWGIKQTRPLWRKFSDYLSVVIILPFFLLAATTVPILDLATRTAGTVAFLGPSMLQVIHSIWMKHMLTVVAVTLGFTFVLVFVPNTRVKAFPGLVGGFVTGVFFMAWLVVCARLQIGIVKYSALYGGFAMLPILLLWIYTSWLIVLLGAEITFALQNGDTCHVDFQTGVSARARLLLCMALCHEAGLRVKNNAGPLAPMEFAHKHGISVRLIMHTVDVLVRHNWLAKVDNRGEAYLPCRDFASLKIANLTTWIFNEGYSPRVLGLDTLDPRLLDAGERINAALNRELQTPLV
jgi:membrane protein